MGDGWVIFGYAVTYAAIGLYVARLVIRTRSRYRAVPPEE